ncbi:MAG: PKD domain-containing protein [Thermoplasmata archaeon]|nr:PKD domain-containing protein [Thermoplasmata archaeon]
MRRDLGPHHRSRPAVRTAPAVVAVVALCFILPTGTLGGHSWATAPPAGTPIGSHSPRHSAIPTAAPSPNDDWTTYGGNAERTGTNPNETTLGPANAARLQLAWTTWLNRTVLGSLIVANQTVLVGDPSGYLVGLNATSGAVLTPTSPHPWETPYLGNTSYSRCGGAGGPGTKHSGLISTPTRIGNRIYENGGNTSFYTLSLDGRVLQRVDLGNHTSKFSPWYFDYNWGSPLIYHGTAYVGIAALCEFNDADPNSADWKYVQGQLLAVDLSSGSVVGIFNVTKGSSVTDLGGSIWSTPAVDPTTNTVWVTTGNENNSAETPATKEYPRSMVALNATTLKLLGACQVGSAGLDADFGAGPTLFHDGRGGRYVGAINKDGTFYAYNATTPSGGNCGSPGTGTLRLAWSDAFCSGFLPGTISPAAFDGQYLYIASDACGNTSGFVDQVYPSNGTIRWSHSIVSPDSEAHAGVASANGLVVVAANQVMSTTLGPGEIQVLNASNGHVLYQHPFVAESNAWPVIADGTIFVTGGNVTSGANGFVAAFRVPLAERLSVGDAACTGTPITSCTAAGSVASFDLGPSGGAPPYTCAWSFGDQSTGNACAVEHHYARPGVYPVQGVLTDVSGAALVSSFNLTVLTIPRGTPGGAAPSPRAGEVLEFDSLENVTVLFGGRCEASPCSGALLNDTWTFHAGSWTNVTAQLWPAPPPLAFSASAYDPQLGAVVVFGGEEPNGTGSPGISHATWKFGHGAWSNLTGQLAGGSPPPTTGARASYDPATSSVVVFGGVTGTDLASGSVTNATWSFANGSWAAVPGIGAPPGREDPGLAYDGIDQQLVLFGGKGTSGSDLNDTWAWASDHWRRIVTTASPPAADSISLVTEGPNAPVLLWNARFPSQTWELSAGTWRPVTTSAAPSVVGTAGTATFVEDPSFVLVIDVNTTWAYRNSTWASIPEQPSITFLPAAPAVHASVSFQATLLGGFPPFSFAWSIAGANAPGTGPTIVFNFSSTGTYPVQLQVRDALGDLGGSEVNVSVGSGLSVAFACFPGNAEAGIPVNFSASSSGGSGSRTLLWDFGDGSSPITGSSAAHTYTRPGTYSVGLSAADAIGNRVNVSSSLLVVAPLGVDPIARFGPVDVSQSVSIRPGLSGGVAPFTLVAFFGDGASAQSLWNGSPPTLPTLGHSYLSPGEVEVTLQAIDLLGAVASTNRSVAVNASLTTPQLIGPTETSVGTVAAFRVTPTGGSEPYSFAWSFGDGGRGAGPNASHTFSGSGTFDVEVLVTDGAGETATTMIQVTVQSTGESSLVLIVSGAAILAAAGAATLVWRVRRRRVGAR